MKQRLVYLLKHNAMLQKLYRVCMSFVFRVIGAFIPLDHNAVLFVSVMGYKFNDSPKSIYDYMQRHSEYKKYRCIWAVERPEDYPQLKTVKIDTLAYFLCALQAKYWVTNANIERGLSFKKEEQVYLSTWHGIAVKHIGNDCPGRKDYNLDRLDYLCVSSDHDERVYKSAFNVQKQAYLRCGMPRNDVLWRVTEGDQQAMRQKLGIPTGKQVILYGPTWRDSSDGGKTYAIKPPIDFEKWRHELGNQYILLFRAHHLTTKVLNVQFNDFIWDVTDYPDVNDLLIAADVLISDYSGLAFEFSILCRPIFCFAYDYDAYKEERGLYFEIDEVYPEKLCKTEDELLKAIAAVDVKAASERTKVFRDRFVQYGGHAAEQCVKSLFG